MFKKHPLYIPVVCSLEFWVHIDFVLLNMVSLLVFSDKSHSKTGILSRVIYLCVFVFYYGKISYSD